MTGPRVLGFDARNARADIRVVFRFTPVDGATQTLAEMEIGAKGSVPFDDPAARSDDETDDAEAAGAADQASRGRGVRRGHAPVS